MNLSHRSSRLKLTVCGFPLDKCPHPHDLLKTDITTSTRSLQTSRMQIVRSDKLWLTAVGGEKKLTKAQVRGAKWKEDRSTPLHLPFTFMSHCFQRNLSHRVVDVQTPVRASGRKR